eukprot:UN24394
MKLFLSSQIMSHKLFIALFPCIYFQISTISVSLIQTVALIILRQNSWTFEWFG